MMTKFFNQPDKVHQLHVISSLPRALMLYNKTIASPDTQTLLIHI